MANIFIHSKSETHFRNPHQKSAPSPSAENCAPTPEYNHSDVETKRAMLCLKTSL
jgi:hypothetical protein